jgi:hypothetical protein
MADAKIAKKPGRKKKAAAEPRSRGIAPDAIGSGTPPPALTRLAEAIEADGGTVLATYKDPLGGTGSSLRCCRSIWSSPPLPARPLPTPRRQAL